MDKHLALIINMHSSQKKLEDCKTGMSDMDIIGTQAALYNAGSITFNAIKAGEIAEILSGLVILAHTALSALARLNGKSIKGGYQGNMEYRMLVIMQLLSQGIHDCSTGRVEYYSALYHLCSHIASDFLNADFNKAFLVYHAWYQVNWNTDDGKSKTQELYGNRLPDLVDCFYE